jgi:hypothetical protein
MNGGDMEESEARKVARRIASYLFHNGAGKHAVRLKLELSKGGDGGGWCERAAEDGVYDILLKVK